MQISIANFGQNTLHFLNSGGKTLILGLVNASTGVVEDIIWAPDSTRSETLITAIQRTLARPNSMCFVWYTEAREGFPNEISFLPISLRTTFEIHTISRTQLPLRLACAVTVPKSLRLINLIPGLIFGSVTF